MRLAMRLLGWLPTPTIGVYVASSFIVLFLVVLAVLVGVLQTLDLLARSDEIMAAEGASRTALWRYVGLRAPQLVDQFAPFAALLASLFALTTFRQRSEITMMRAAGLSAPRILLPMMTACALIATSHAVFSETVVVPTTAKLAHWEKNDFRGGLERPQQVRNDIWLLRGTDIIKAEEARWAGGSFVMTGLTVYHRDTVGRIVRTDRALTGEYTDGTWRLYDLRRLDLETGEVIKAPIAPWAVELRPAEVFAVATVPSETSWPELTRRIEQLRAAGLPADALETAALHRFSAPLASIFMPLLAGIAGFGASRHGGLLIRVIFGMALGFGYFVVDNLARAMGDFGILPPYVAALSPTVLFTIIGLAMMLELER